MGREIYPIPPALAKTSPFHPPATRPSPPQTRWPYFRFGNDNEWVKLVHIRVKPSQFRIMLMPMTCTTKQKRLILMAQLLSRSVLPPKEKPHAQDRNLPVESQGVLSPAPTELRQPSRLRVLLVAGRRLIHAGLKQLREQGETKKKVLHLPPISQLKVTMRQMIWDEAVEDVIKKSHERAVIRRLELLRAA
jgi:hypothetical protein